jgi:hypothetical protein
MHHEGDTKIVIRSCMYMRMHEYMDVYVAL